MRDCKRKKRILFITHEASLTGAPIFLSNLLQYIQSNCATYESMLHSVIDGPLIPKFQKMGIQTVILGARPLNAFLLNKLVNRFLYYFNFLALLGRFKPDLIYSNTIVNFPQVVLGRLAGAKTIVHMHEGSNFASKKRLKLKFSSIFTTKYIVGSKYVSDVLKSHVGIDGVIIHNGIKVGVAEPEQLIRHVENYSICVIGTIDPNKAQLTAIKATEYLASFMDMKIQLKLVGKIADKHYYNELKSYIDNKDISNFVEFVGSVDKIDSVYNNADALVVCSLDEAFPTVILEAMAFKCPAVASNIGGIPEIIQDGLTGLLFDVGSYKDLAKKVSLLLNDNDLRAKIISNASLKVATDFSLLESNQKIVSVIDSVLN